MSSWHYSSYTSKQTSISIGGPKSINLLSWSTGVAVNFSGLSAPSLCCDGYNESLSEVRWLCYPYVQYSVYEDVNPMSFGCGDGADKLLFGAPTCWNSAFLVEFAEVPLIQRSR